MIIHTDRLEFDSYPVGCYRVLRPNLPYDCPGEQVGLAWVMLLRSPARLASELGITEQELHDFVHHGREPRAELRRDARRLVVAEAFDIFREAFGDLRIAYGVPLPREAFMDLMRPRDVPDKQGLDYAMAQILCGDQALREVTGFQRGFISTEGKTAEELIRECGL